MALRDYQIKIKQDINDLWNGGQANVMAVMPTGAGKTVTMASLCEDVDERSVAIAHRQELVGQISLAFARQGLAHRVIAPAAAVRAIVEQHVEEIGRNWTNPRADVAVAGIDTLIRREDEFFDRVTFWQQDEAHHVLEGNKWGRGIAKLRNARRGVGWTATPLRTDKKALRRGSGGVFDALAVGPSMRTLIDRGYLAEFRIYSVPSSVDTGAVHVSPGGEFNGAELREAVATSSITGDIVKTYLTHAAGKMAVTFAVDVALAHEHAAAFEAAGVRSAVLHADTPARERVDIIRDYRNGHILNIVNVDVLGEGFDCPGIEVAIFARPTMSYGLYVQQFGRTLRMKAGKRFGLILDHVGNVVRHRGAPDRGRAWTLDSTKREVTPREVPIRSCGNPDCMQVYEAFEPACPFCGWEPTPSEKQRQRPELVEGDLTLYTPELLNRLRDEADRIADAPMIPPHLSSAAAGGLRKAWEARATAQAELAQVIDAWAGVWHHEKGETLGAVYRRFWHTYGMDTLSALTLSGPKQRELAERIRRDMG